MAIGSWFRYSRKILWLKVTPTNHNPRVIVKYFLDTVGEIGGVTFYFVVQDLLISSQFLCL